MNVRGPRVVLTMEALQGTHAPERGIARYVLETTRALLRRGADVRRLGLSPSRGVPDFFPEDLLATGLVGWLTEADLEEQRRQGPTVLHAFSPFELLAPIDALYLPAVNEAGCGLTATFYDAIPAADRERYLRERLARQRYDVAARHLAGCDRVMAISRHAAEEAVEQLAVDAHRTVVVGAGAGSFFQPSAHTGDQSELLRAAVPEVGPRFVLTVGGEEPRKNLGALIDAFAALGPDVRAGCRLVQAGNVSADGADSLRARGRAAGLRDDELVVLGRVDDIVLRALYQECALFVFPSLSEGFGLPVLEAARCGAPVITSDRTSVPEVLDDPSSTFDAGSVESISAAITRGLRDEAFRAELLEQGRRAAELHTWDAVADRMIATWESMPLAAPRRTAVRRVAVIGSFQRGAGPGGPVARQHLALAEAMAASAEVTCFETRDGAIEARTELPMAPVSALGATTAVTRFERIVHLVDAVPTPAALLGVRRHPDVVVVGPDGLRRGLPIWPLGPEDRGWLERELVATQWERLTPDLRNDGIDAAREAPVGRPFGSRPLLHDAALVVTPSERDASLLRVELGPHAATQVASVAPAATPIPRVADERRVIWIGDTTLWSWTTAKLIEDGFQVDVLPVDDDPGGDHDRRWTELLPRAGCVVLIDHRGPREHLAWAVEAIAAGAAVVTTGPWAGAFPPGVVRRVEPDASNVTMAAIVAGLAEPSPMRREQQRRARWMLEHRGPQHVAADLFAAMDGREPAPWAPEPPARPVGELGVASSICRMTDFRAPEFADWCGHLGEPLGPRRKLWEYVVIARGFERREVLAPGRRGLGFGVGTEPLAAAFAARGCCITATDLAADRPEAAEWSPTGQHASRVADLNRRGLCPPDRFEQLVEFRPVDMTDIPADLDGAYDFCWSSCALEHLGSIEAGLTFIEQSLRTLRPGGIAVHTTELVLSSDVRTLEDAGTVLFRECDLRRLVERLEAAGHHVAPLDHQLGDELLDGHIDVAPYSNEPHLKLELAGHVTTSVALIVQRG